MKPPVRKFALFTHLTFSIGWIGAVVAYLALAVAAEASQDAPTVRAAWTAMELTGWFVIVPLALASLLTGLVMALGTRWGLFRHYWVTISFVLTVIATTVLLVEMQSVSDRADIARQANADDLDEIGAALLHPAVGLVVLLAIQVLNVYKPRGLTRYGQRKQHEQRRQRPDGQRAMPAPSSSPAGQA